MSAPHRTKGEGDQEVARPEPRGEVVARCPFGEGADSNPVDQCQLLEADRRAEAAAPGMVEDLVDDRGARRGGTSEPRLKIRCDACPGR